MAKLLRVILIDSLCRGEIIEVRTDENTCLTGTNGIGKSTFLKLLPLFYGAPAGRMVRKGTNTTSFADHYLPHASSYIVFEYENHESAKRIVILHRSSSGYAYQFIASGWNPELLYVDLASGELVLPGRISSRVQSMGIDCTPELSWSHYCKIIQYNTGSADMEGITDAASKKMINLYRRMYSLAPFRRNFAGIDSLMFSLLESKGTFDSMESAVGEIIRQETMRSEIDLSGIDAQSFMNAISNRASYLVMDREVKPKIVRLSALRSRLMACDSQLGRLKTVATSCQQVVLKEQQNVIDLMETIRAEESSAQEKAREATRGIENRLGEERATSTEFLRLVTTLEKQRAAYEADGFHGLLVDLDRLPAMQEQQTAKKEQLSIMTSRSADIMSRFTAMEQAAMESFSARRESRRKETEARLRDVADQLGRHNQETEVGIARATKAHMDDLSQHELTRSRLAAANASANAEVEFLSKQKLLPDTAEQIDVEQTALTGLYESQEQVRKNIVEHEAQVTSVVSEQQRLAAEMSALVRNRDELGSQIKQLKARLNAADGTLLSFLRSSLPGWENTVGRVIDPRLLLREDLSPGPCESDNGLFGLQLDLERLEPVEALNLDQLESQIAALNLQIDELIDAEAELVRSSSAAQARRKILTQERVQLDSNAVGFEADISARKQRIESLRDEGEENLAIAKAKAEEAANKAAQALNSKECEIHELKSGFGRHIVELNAIASQARKDLEAQRATIELGLREALADLEGEHADQVGSIEADRLSALQGAGIDTASVRKLENEVAELQRSIKRLTEQLPRIQEYKAWMETALPLLPLREAKYAEAEQVVARMDRELQAMRIEDELRQKMHRARQAELSARNGEMTNKLSVLRSVLDRLNTVYAVSSGIESLDKLSPADLESEVGRLERDAQLFTTDGRKLLREIETPFNFQYRATPEAGVVQDIILRARNADAAGERVWFYAAPDLQMYIDDGHDGQRSKLITYIRTLCNQLVEGGKVLAEVDKTIQDVGGRATLKVSQVLGRFPEFTDFHLNVTSKIKELKIWDHIKALDLQYNRWEAMESGAFPSDGLDHALRMLHSAMINNQWKGAKIEECFEVSLSWQVNGQPRIARNTSDLGDGLSTGQLKIVVGMIYLALFEMIRRDADFELIVPVDEALELEVNNAATLVKNFNSRNVKLMLGFPGGAPELMRHFKNLYALDRRRSGGVYLKEYRGVEPFILDELNAGLPDQEEALA